MSSNEKIKNKELNELKKDLDQANNLVDYFLVAGLDPEIAFSDWLYEAKIEELNKVYPNKMKPKIISYFPPFQKGTIAFDDSILQHCFPNKFEVIQSQTQPKPEIFSFILDNNYFSINFPQKFISCLICYESIRSYQKIFNKKKEILESENQRPSISLRDSETMPSSAYFPSNNVSATHSSSNSMQFFNDNNSNYYVPKCLMIMSLYPFFGEFEKMLSKIYEYSLGTEIFIPMDKIIENITIEIPVPPRGIFNIKYILIDQERELPQTLVNQLPLVDIDLKILFQHFSTEKIIQIYRYLILECRILFFSKNYVLLNPFIFGMLSLLYPFAYQYQVITILPEENFEIIESITPFIAGINETYTKDFFTTKGLALSDNIAIVDIDNKEIVVVEGNNSFVDDEPADGNKIPELPRKQKRDLEKDLKSFVLSKRIFQQNENEEINFEFNKVVQEKFFNFNANLLNKYDLYLKLDFYCTNKMPELKSLFRLDEYLLDKSSCDRPFFKKFLDETQIFGNFLYKRMIPKDSNEKLEILAFDERIKENSAGIFSTITSIFTESQDYKFVNNFRVQKPRTPTDFEIEYYSQVKNQEELLSYGVIIDKNKDNDIIFNYPIFPRLTTDKFFLNNIKEYFIPSVSTEEIELINAEIVSKSHLGGIEVMQSDMENYIDLCWIQVWAMSFWYCDKIEKQYRFWCLLQVIKNATHHEMEIFNILFETLSKFGEDYMILKLYAMILDFHLIPTYKIRETIMKLLDKSQYKSINEKNITEKLKEQKIERLINDNAVFDLTKFRKRTFKNIYNANVLNEDVVFYAFDTCLECQREINLEALSKDYDAMKRDILWAKCPFCNEAILPKISIKFGSEMNKKGKLKHNTSVFDCVVLFSPQFLKQNYSNSLLKEFGVKLNIEEFKMRYGAIFWNSIWYFKLKGLDYDFILPYEYSIDMTPLNELNTHLSITTTHVEEIDKIKKKKKKFSNLLIQKTSE